MEFAQAGLPVVIVNPTVPLGWGDLVPTPTGSLAVSYLNGLLPLGPAWDLNVVSVRDVARGHVMAAKQGRVGEKYVLGGENLGFPELLKILDEFTGFGASKRTFPPRALLPLAYVGEFVSRWITHRDPFVSRQSVRVMDASYVFDVSKARRELTLDPLPARMAVQEAVQWFMSTPLVKEKRKRRYEAYRVARAAATA